MTNEPTDLMINTLVELRERKRQLKQELDQVDQKYKELEQRIVGTLKALGTDTFRTQLASATLSVTRRKGIEDFHQLAKWILEDPSERIYLMERRLAQNSVREFEEMYDEAIPGTYDFEQQRISLRKR